MRVMTKRTTLFFIVAVAASFLVPVKAAPTPGSQVKYASERKALIGPIKGSPFGCGCGFSKSRNRFTPLIFSSDIDEETAIMNIDGVDIELRLVRSTEPKGKEGVGSHLTRTYVAAGVRVFAAYVTTRMCKPNDEDCEATEYDATVAVTKGARKQTIKIKGACGC